MYILFYSLSIMVYICIYICIYVCIYIYIYFFFNLLIWLYWVLVETRGIFGVAHRIFSCTIQTLCFGTREWGSNPGPCVQRMES